MITKASQLQSKCKIPITIALTSVPSSLLQRKCACGSHTMAGGECEECAKGKGTLQRKLMIGASNDPLEQEADRVAEQVMTLPLNSIVNATPLRIQRFTGHTSESLETVPSSVDNTLASTGRPLEPALRQDMEARFGQDFSHVQVHTGEVAEQSALDVSAHAYTVGHNVVFGAGQFAPGTHTGQRLIAHELTHVLQQEGGKMQGGSTLRLLRAERMLQRQRFRDCTPTITSTTGVLTQAEIDEMIRSALRLARIAVDDAAAAVRRVINGTATAAQQAAMTRHFGALTPAQRNNVLTRYTRIRTRLANESLLICNTVGSAYCRRGWCAYADCPGAGHSTHICPPFFQTDRPCGVTRWEVFIEEAAHSLGACGNVAMGVAGYPPANAQNNGPSYAYFAAEARALAFVRPTLRPPAPERPRFPSLIEGVIRSQDERMRERVLESIPD